MEAFGYCSFQASVFRPFVECNGEDNDQADDSGLPERRDTKKDQSVPEHADDEDSKNGPEDGPFATGKRCSANYGGGNYVKFKSNAGPSGLTAWQESETQNAGESAEQPHQHESKNLGVKHLDT